MTDLLGFWVNTEKNKDTRMDDKRGNYLDA